MKDLPKIQARRMYYLVNQLKKYIPVKAWDRFVDVPINLVDSLPEKYQRYIGELTDRFHFGFQLRLPF